MKVQREQQEQTQQELSSRVCPVCLTSTPRQSLGMQEQFSWHLCKQCGTRFVDRYPTHGEIAALYNAYYGDQDLTISDFLKSRLAEIVSTFEPYRKTGQLLDVGYGSGGILAAAQAAGWTCWGTEVSPKALRIGRHHGWRVTEGEFPESSLPSATFDVVCMSEVIEHLPDPLVYMREALRVLRPGGIFFFTTPNGAGINSRVLGTKWSVFSAPEHLQLFSPSSLERALKSIGFTSFRCRTTGIKLRELPGRFVSRKRLSGEERAQSSYELNKRLSSRKSSKLMMVVANKFLTVTQLGDSLKGFAETPRS